MSSGHNSPSTIKPTSQHDADVIVLGAGMGGLCAAAYLTAAGYRVLVLEKSRYMGGRCSHREREGFTVTTGAIMIAMGPDSAIRQRLMPSVRTWTWWKPLAACVTGCCTAITTCRGGGWWFARHD